jgi:hypothetical protein
MDGTYSDGSLHYEQISARLTGKTVQFTGSYTSGRP